MARITFHQAVFLVATVCMKLKKASKILNGLHGFMQRRLHSFLAMATMATMATYLPSAEIVADILLTSLQGSLIATLGRATVDA